MPLAVKRAPIRFCVHNYPGTNISDDSLIAQVKYAFAIYLATIDPDPQRSVVEQVSCWSNDFNVDVRVGPFEGTYHENGMVLPDSQDDPKFLHLYLNSHAGGISRAPTLQDTLALLNGAGMVRLAELIAPLYGNVRQGLPEAFLPSAGMDDRYFHSSWPTILHEVGHLFGLGDTYGGEERAALQWEPTLRAAPGRLGVMLAVDCANLLPDDIDGLRAFKQATQSRLTSMVATPAAKKMPLRP